MLFFTYSLHRGFHMEFYSSFYPTHQGTRWEISNYKVYLFQVYIEGLGKGRWLRAFPLQCLCKCCFLPMDAVHFLFGFPNFYLYFKSQFRETFLSDNSHIISSCMTYSSPFQYTEEFRFYNFYKLI